MKNKPPKKNPRGTTFRQNPNIKTSNGNHSAKNHSSILYHHQPLTLLPSPKPPRLPHPPIPFHVPPNHHQSPPPLPSLPKPPPTTSPSRPFSYPPKPSSSSPSSSPKSSYPSKTPFHIFSSSEYTPSQFHLSPKPLCPSSESTQFCRPISDHLKSPQIHNHVTSFKQLSNFSLSLKSQNLPTHSKSSISNLTFICFNARSILSKLDELSAICSIHSPDIICIVESWLSPDIPNFELFLPNYSTFRCDRNRHGGGILIYTKCSLRVSEIQLNTNLEFILLSIKLKLTTYNLGAFYCPPASSVDIDS